MKNAVIYARFSSHAQNEQSIEGQLAECRAFAERNNLRIVREYIDRALTGTTDKRPDFLQMIEDSKRKGFQFVIVYQLDRFARNRYDSATYKAKLKKERRSRTLRERKYHGRCQRHFNRGRFGEYGGILFCRLFLWTQIYFH